MKMLEIRVVLWGDETQRFVAASVGHLEYTGGGGRARDNAGFAINSRATQVDAALVGRHTRPEKRTPELNVAAVPGATAAVDSCSFYNTQQLLMLDGERFGCGFKEMASAQQQQQQQ